MERRQSRLLIFVQNEVRSPFDRFLRYCGLLHAAAFEPQKSFATKGVDRGQRATDGARKLSGGHRRAALDERLHHFGLLAWELEIGEPRGDVGLEREEHDFAGAGLATN